MKNENFSDEILGKLSEFAHFPFCHVDSSRISFGWHAELGGQRGQALDYFSISRTKKGFKFKYQFDGKMLNEWTLGRSDVPNGMRAFVLRFIDRFLQSAEDIEFSVLNFCHEFVA